MKRPLFLKFLGILNDGLILAFVFITISLTLYIVDIYKTPPWLTFLFLVLLIIGLSLFTKDFRNNKLNGYISYSKAFNYSFLVSMIASVTYGVYFFLLIFVIDPNYCETIYAIAAESYYDLGMNDYEVETALSLFKRIQSPLVMVLSSIVGFMIMGTVSAFIAAFVVKKNEPLTKS